MSAPTPTPMHALLTLSRLGMQALALGVLGLLLVKALVDAPSHFDSWWYHLPWAARLAGLTTPAQYAFEPIAAMRFEGFPLLPELLQGWLWRLSGTVQAANLINLMALVAFLIFLRRFLQVAWWLAVPALLAVPLIQAHVTSAYVDLFANLGLATCVLALYTLYVRPAPARPAQLAALLIGAFVAMHSKMQLWPLVALALLAAVWPLRAWLAALLARRAHAAGKALVLAAATLVVLAIFFVPLKNLALHGNPVYPLKISVLGLSLPGTEAKPPQHLGGGELAHASQLTKWFYSVAELGMGPVLDVRRWSLDSAAPPGAPLGIQGGLFGAYVLFHALLFLALVIRLPRRERAVALLLVGVGTLAAAAMPASHLLRYYMFWLIVLISLNLHFLARSQPEWPRLALATVCLGFALVVVDASDQNFVRPRFHDLQALLQQRVDPHILRQLDAARGPVCLALDQADKPFLYASIWHPGTDYRITAGPFYPQYEDQLQRVCANKIIIRSR